MRPWRRLTPIMRVFLYWRAERRTIATGLIGLAVATVANVGAGYIFGAITGRLEAIPGLIILLPAANSTRGSIFGAMASRLGTSIHTGLFDPGRGRRGPLRDNLMAGMAITFGAAAVMGSFANPTARAFGNRAASVADLFLVSVVGGAAASLVVVALIAALATVASRRSWDLDTIGTPIVTAVGDVATIPALLGATYLLDRGVLTVLLLVIAALATVAWLVVGVAGAGIATRRLVGEGLPIIIATGLVTLGAGVMLQERIGEFLRFPVLLVLVPPLLASTGAMGAVLAARLASKLHLGTLRPDPVPGSLALLDGSLILLLSVWLFALVGLGAHAIGAWAGFLSPGVWAVVRTSLVAGVSATVVACVLAYYAAVATYRVGLDPDNHAIPIITSSMDVVSVFALSITLALFGLS